MIKSCCTIFFSIAYFASVLNISFPGDYSDIHCIAVCLYLTINWIEKNIPLIVRNYSAVLLQEEKISRFFEMRLKFLIETLILLKEWKINNVTVTYPMWSLPCWTWMRWISQLSFDLVQFKMFETYLVTFVANWITTNTTHGLWVFCFHCIIDHWEEQKEMNNFIKCLSRGMISYRPSSLYARHLRELFSHVCAKSLISDWF